MNTMEIARGLIVDALKPHFKGRNAQERLNAAASDVISATEHLLTLHDAAPKKKIGATVLTENASASKLVRPRNL